MPSSTLPAVAVIADAHFHDLEGDYDFAGIRVGERRLTMRSWADTRRSTRVFNESFAALPAALDEIHGRGIRHVVLLGDYTDDGQRKTTDSVVDLLQRYRDDRGLSFYALPGNHDVFGPRGKHQLTRYVAEDGGSALVTSDPDAAAGDPHHSILTAKMYCEGQPAGLLPMAGFGYFHQPGYLHWETPFGSNDAPEARMYDIFSADGQTLRRLMDASYLVEPEAGLWLLMIDANVFEPQNGNWDMAQKKAFIDSSNAGWNAVLRLKPFLIDWIADVSARAKKRGKCLLGFSHYPVIDPFDQGSVDELALFGRTAIVKRTPAAAVAEALAGAGLHVHFSGHYHVNGLSSRNIGGRTLTNIAVPSLVAFPAAFKIVRPLSQAVDVETVTLSAMAVDPTVLAVYAAETRKAGEEPDAAFSAHNYGDFLYAHGRALAVHRFMPREWPEEVMEAIGQRSAEDLCLLMMGAPVAFQGASATLAARAADPRLLGALADLAGCHAIDIEDLQNCAMSDLIADWYCLRQARGLALGYISPERIALYRFLAEQFGDAAASERQSLTAYMARFLAVLGYALWRAMPDDGIRVQMD